MAEYDAAHAALLAHIVGEDARVAAAVAGAVERCAQVAERVKEPDGIKIGLIRWMQSRARIAAAIRETPSA